MPSILQFFTNLFWTVNAPAEPEATPTETPQTEPPSQPSHIPSPQDQSSSQEEDVPPGPNSLSLFEALEIGPISNYGFKIQHPEEWVKRQMEALYPPPAPSPGMPLPFLVYKTRKIGVADTIEAKTLAVRVNPLVVSVEGTSLADDRNNSNGNGVSKDKGVKADVLVHDSPAGDDDSAWEDASEDEDKSEGGNQGYPGK
ncbi:hypothetical protein RUND412_005230 [Rhizina undulata]